MIARDQCRVVRIPSGHPANTEPIPFHRGQKFFRPGRMSRNSLANAASRGSARHIADQTGGQVGEIAG